MWRAVRESLADPDADQVAELAERLGLVISCVRSAALRRCVAGPSGAAWPGLLEASVARAERSGAELALIVVELEDARRVVAVEGQDGASVIFDGVAGAVRRAIDGRRGSLVREVDERRWVVIASDTDTAGARSLRERIVRQVAELPPWRGAPLIADVGVAVLRENGDDAEQLIEAAERAMLAAAAVGSRPDG